MPTIPRSALERWRTSGRLANDFDDDEPTLDGAYQSLELLFEEPDAWPDATPPPQRLPTAPEPQHGPAVTATPEPQHAPAVMATPEPQHARLRAAFSTQEEAFFSAGEALAAVADLEDELEARPEPQAPTVQAWPDPTPRAAPSPTRWLRAARDAYLGRN